MRAESLQLGRTAGVARVHSARSLFVRAILQHAHLHVALTSGGLLVAAFALTKEMAGTRCWTHDECVCAVSWSATERRAQRFCMLDGGFW